MKAYCIAASSIRPAASARKNRLRSRTSSQCLTISRLKACSTTASSSLWWVERSRRLDVLVVGAECDVMVSPRLKPCYDGQDEHQRSAAKGWRSGGTKRKVGGRRRRRGAYQ